MQGLNGPLIPVSFGDVGELDHDRGREHPGMTSQRLRREPILHEGHGTTYIKLPVFSAGSNVYVAAHGGCGKSLHLRVTDCESRGNVVLGARPETSEHEKHGNCFYAENHPVTAGIVPLAQKVAHPAPRKRRSGFRNVILSPADRGAMCRNPGAV